MNSQLKAFHFTTEIEKDSFGIGFAPLLDLCVVIVLFVWLSSQFTFSPGVPVDLPQSERELQGIPCAAVLTVAGRDALFLEGDRFELNDIAPALRALMEREKGPVSLLLKMNKRSNMATFLSICEIARANGIQSVQIASETTNNRALQD